MNQERLVHPGGCHCGAVRFEVHAPMIKLLRCNCSICFKKGGLIFRVPSEQFKLLQGEDQLRLYQFNTKTASHYFCQICGFHPYSNPRINPAHTSVNTHCLDDQDFTGVQIVDFDGQNWERAVGQI